MMRWEREKRAARAYERFVERHGEDADYGEYLECLRDEAADRKRENY